MNKINNYIVLLTIILVSTACSNTKSNKNNPANKLYNEWKLVTVNGAAVNASSDAGLILHADKKVSGSTGCNRITGSFEAETNGTMKFSPLGTTRMACNDATINKIEADFLEALAAVNSWKIEKDTLYLLGDEKIAATLVVKKALTDVKAKLNGTWELNYISGPRIAFQGLYPDKKPTITFNFPDSLMAGNSSCNSFSKPVSIEKNKISFGDGLSTLMACEGEGEPVFFKMLNTVNAYSLSEDAEILNFLHDGIEVMRFTKK